MTNLPSERRTFTRIHFDGKTTLQQHDQQWPVNLLDLSLKGLLIEQPDIDWHANLEQPFDIHIKLDQDINISMKVNWRHSDNGQIGLECENIDIDSIIHLRRLVELNLGNQSLLERELTALGDQ